MWIPGPEGDFFTELKYLHGFIQLQDLIDRAIIGYYSEKLDSLSILPVGGRKKRAAATNPVDDIGVYTSDFPYPCYEKDGYLSGMYTVQMLTVCLYIGFAVTIASAIRFQAWEKESQNADMMQVMGMRHSVVWVVWLLISAANMVVISVALSLILSFGGLLPKTDPAIVFILLLVYSLSVLAFWYVK